MNKIVRIGTIKPEGTKRSMSVFCKIEFKDGKLSISGVEGPLRSGNCRGSCGQIDMGLSASDFNTFADGWSRPTARMFFCFWKKWHLNDLHAGCKHQRELGWETDGQHSMHISEECPECGYRYGSAWKKVEVPKHVIDFLFSLPDADKTPAWV